MKKINSLFKTLAFATLGLCSISHAQTPNTPDEASIVKAQGNLAMVQLQALSYIYSADPSGKFSTEAFNHGWAPVSLAYASPTHGWPARGPSLSESIEPLFAQSLASKNNCEHLEGPCQDQASALAKKIAKKILSSRNPGKELLSQVSSLKP